MSKPNQPSGPSYVTSQSSSPYPNTDDQRDDPFNPKLASAALDFLLIELVPQMQRVAEQVLAREIKLREAHARSRLLHSHAREGSGIGEDEGKGVDGSNSVGKTGSGAPMSEELRDAVFWRLDSLGYRVGQGLVERFSTNKPRPQTPLDAIKFVCKDLWQLVFRKQIDNLKTNHRGVFVLTDQRFYPLSRMSADRRAGPKAVEEAVSRAQLYLYFPAGIIRGALAGLGMEASVTAESTELPTATFQIKTKGAKA